MGYIIKRCPLCGACLDANEVCDCQWKALPVRQHREGKAVEQVGPGSTSIVPQEKEVCK